MRIIFGSIVTNAVGSIGGQFIKRIRGGHSLNNKPARGSLQVLQNNSALVKCGAVIRNWNVQTLEERTAWSTLASENPTSDTFGNLKYLTGREFYIKMMSRRLQYYTSYITASAWVPTVDEITGGNVNINISDGEATLNIVYTGIFLMVAVRMEKIPYERETLFTCKSAPIAVANVDDGYTSDIWDAMISKFGVITEGQYYMLTLIGTTESGVQTAPFNRIVRANA